MSLTTVLLGAAALSVGIVLVVALQVDDWGRDLTTNVAETAEHAADTLLRPVTTQLPLDDAAARVRDAAKMPRWRFSRQVEHGSVVRLEFVRTSRLIRFRDDVTVWIDDAGHERRIRARSASRVGGADLGQNPRNLRLLMREVRDRLP